MNQQCLSRTALPFLKRFFELYTNICAFCCMYLNFKININNSKFKIKSRWLEKNRGPFALIPNLKYIIGRGRRATIRVRKRISGPNHLILPLPQSLEIKHGKKKLRAWYTGRIVPRGNHGALCQWETLYPRPCGDSN